MMAMPKMRPVIIATFYQGVVKSVLRRCQKPVTALALALHQCNRCGTGKPGNGTNIHDFNQRPGLAPADAGRLRPALEHRLHRRQVRPALRGAADLPYDPPVAGGLYPGGS